MSKKVFITTSIPYVNSDPHIGFALELAEGDTLARYYRDKLGEDQVLFLNGADEHGSKIDRKAKETGVETQDFVDNITQKFIDLGKKLNVSNDDFVRTTSDRHKKVAAKLWELCKKDIYKKAYKSLYCTGCEEFKTEKELVDGCCPIHKTKPELVEEENYFFALSKYAPQIRELIETDKLKITPELRKNEVLGWLNSETPDISVSREKAKLSWGVPVPGDDNQVMYVWVDALSNYLTGAGWPEKNDWWNEETLKIHVIGKDILRFHAVIWIGLLLSADLPIPNIIYAHGHITADNQKMSKSLGNVVDPFELIEKYGADAVRYFLLAKIPWDGDGDFSLEKFRGVYKGELGDSWGNLLNRVVVLANKAGVETNYQGSMINDQESGDINQLENFKFSQYIEKQISELSNINGEINLEKPWELIESNPEKAKEIISKWLETISILSQKLSPVTPETFKKIEKIYTTGESVQLFPRID